MKNKEIEAKLNYKSRADVIKKIVSLGGKKGEKFVLEDTYFGAQGSTMSKRNNLIRVRTKKSGEKLFSEITFKGNCRDKKGIWERSEITAGVSDGKIAKQIFQKIGLVKISENKSEREEYVLGKCELMFIDFVLPHRISILEVEGPSEKEVGEIILKLVNLVSKTGEDAFRKFDESRK